MPEPRLPARLNKKFTALGVVGAVMVALPMLQLLRYQDDEIHTLQARRAALDPMADAVDVQRGLMAHAALAGPVLQGRAPLEPERRLRQAEVDQQLDALGQSLAAGDWRLAQREANELATDWAQLAGQVEQRRINAVQSDQAHRLRVEQALQVMDLLTLTAAPGDAGAALLALREVPRLAWQSTLPGSGDDAHRAAQAAAGLAKARQALQATTAAQADTGLQHALQQASQAASRWQANPQANPQGDAQGSAQATLQAHWALLGATHEYTARALGQQVQRAQALRAGMLVLMAALGALGLWLLLALARQAAPRGAPHGAPRQLAPQAGHRPAAHSRGEAGRLLHRLRQTSVPPPRADEARQGGEQATPDAQPTLPPGG